MGKIICRHVIALALLAAPFSHGVVWASDLASTLARPDVVMKANPVPPFTYWAPEGSTIRNHPRVAGLWTAEVEGKIMKSYAGDQCHASRYQQLVGQQIGRIPAAPKGEIWRISCHACEVESDLVFSRMNLLFDETTRMIVAAECG